MQQESSAGYRREQLMHGASLTSTAVQLQRARWQLRNLQSSQAQLRNDTDTLQRRNWHSHPYGSSGTAPLSYTFNAVTNATGVFSGVTAGAAYAWSITDVNSCTAATGTLAVTEPAVITGSASVTTPILCNGGTGTVTLRRQAAQHLCHIRSMQLPMQQESSAG